MKNRLRFLGITSLIAGYCIAVISVSYSPKSFALDNPNSQTTEQKQYLAGLSKSLFHHTSESEGSVNSFINLPVPNVDNLIEKLWLISLSREQFFEATFTQYCHFFINFLIRYRKSDLIFPFHYFW